MTLSKLHLFLFYQGILYVLGWEPIGHSLVARLAQSQLNLTTNHWIDHYLGWDLYGDLSRIASWPDVILYSDSNPFDFNEWQWSRELHFINIPDWNCEYNSSRVGLNE